MKFVFVIFFLGFFSPTNLLAKKISENVPFTLKSKQLKHKQDIPTKYTCQGQDISPDLSWTGLPKGTKSLVLIVDDPDAPDPKAPKMTWVHWILYNIPPKEFDLKEAIAAPDLPQGTFEGLNDWKKPGYRGPCPPIGKHRYFHKLIALDIVLTDVKVPDKENLEKAMKGHILGQAELIGMFQKN